MADRCNIDTFPTTLAKNKYFPIRFGTDIFERSRNKIYFEVILLIRGTVVPHPNY